MARKGKAVYPRLPDGVGNYEALSDPHTYIDEARALHVDHNIDPDEREHLRFHERITTRD